MDRYLVYPAQIPLDLNILQPQRSAMVALGFLMQATFGTGTIADGLQAQPTSPASLSVNITPGSIIQNSVVDQTAFGSLPADTADSLVKMGISLSTVTLGPFAAPSTPGQSQAYLVQAALSETDGGATVLTYYNAANPAQAFAGPNNSGSSQNTTRTQSVTMQIKAGAPATTGSQVTPTPDTGFVGLWSVAVASGQTTITAGNIVVYGTAPFLQTKLALGQTRTKLAGDLNLYVAQTGSDSNNGLSPQFPFATLQGAWNALIAQYDANGHNVIVNVANGTYTAGLNASGTVTGIGRGNTVSIVGNVGSPASVLVSTTNAHAIQATNGGSISVSGLKVQASGSAGTSPAGGIVASTGGSIAVTGPVVFGQCAGIQVWSTQGATISVVSNYSITAGGLSHFDALASGQIIIETPITVTLTGSPPYSVGFAVASVLGVISFSQSSIITFSGTATGPKYGVSANGVINTGGAGVSYFPGSEAGSTSSGGQYV